MLDSHPWPRCAGRICARDSFTMWNITAQLRHWMLRGASGPPLCHPPRPYNLWPELDTVILILPSSTALYHNYPHQAPVFFILSNPCWPDSNFFFPVCDGFDPVFRRFLLEGQTQNIYADFGLTFVFICRSIVADSCVFEITIFISQGNFLY